MSKLIGRVKKLTKKQIAELRKRTIKDSDGYMVHPSNKKG